MEFGNVYEVFHIGDRVEVNDIRYVYYGRTGTIIDVDETDPFGEPIYTIALDSAWTLDDDGQPHEIQINATSIEKIPRKAKEEEAITMGVRSGKTYLTQIGRCKNKDNGFDSIIYQMEKKRKFAKRGTDEMKNVDVKKIIFSGPKTIVLWSDGTKTIVSMSKDETNFDPEAAFCAAYTKKMFGTNSEIKRVIKEKSNIEQHQRIVEEKLKEELAKISQDYDKFMRELCPWLYTGEKLTEVDSACANAIIDFYKKEFVKGKDGECLGKLGPCGDLENAKAEMEDEESSNEDMEKSDGNN